MTRYFASIVLENICITVGVSICIMASSMEFAPASTVFMARLLGIVGVVLGVLGMFTAFHGIARRLRCCIHRY